jgi:ATPase family associated with various cellular activities (AAA)
MPKPHQPKPPSSDSAGSLSDVGAKIVHYIQAGYPGLYVVSAEEQRVEAEFKAVVTQLNAAAKLNGKPPYTLCYWTVVNGLVNTDTKQVQNCNDPLEVLDTVAGLKENAIVLLKDFHLFLTDPNPILLRKLKDTLLLAKTTQKPLILLGCRLCLPPELEHELTVVEFTLPGKPELRTVLGGVMESAGIKSLEIEVREKAVEAASGLTTMEAENAFSLSYVQTRTIEPQIVALEKAQAVKKNGLLEIVEIKETLNSIGGLDLLKDWLLRRKDAFSQRAQAYGLPALKGLLILGLPGTGKSLTAKATAAVFNVPLLKLDAGKLYGGIVGQSEANLRAVINTAEAIAPCCLWIDELEKGFAGSKSSGTTDGGTSARVFGSFLSWMQEKVKPVFVVATANDVSQLPPEMLRKGRFDELFFVDLPNEVEREAIWKIVVERRNRKAIDYDLRQLSRITAGLTGAEIDAVFLEAMFSAFERSKEPTDLDVAAALNGFVPLSRLMAEQIAALKQWSVNRARPATSQPTASEPTLRKLEV